MNRIFPAAVLFSLAMSRGAFGIVDQDGDGLSDVWEMKHHFPVVSDYPNSSNAIGMASEEIPRLAPGADPDQDSFTNLQESIDGTDPWNPMPGAGRCSSAFNRSSSGAQIEQRRSLEGKGTWILRT